MIESYDNAWFRNHFDDISVSLHCYICSPEKLISPVWFVYYAVCDSFCNQATSPHLDHLAGNKHLNCWSRNGDKGTPQCKLSKNMEVKKEKKNRPVHKRRAIFNTFYVGDPIWHQLRLVAFKIAIDHHRWCHPRRCFVQFLSVSWRIHTARGSPFFSFEKIKSRRFVRNECGGL